MDEFLIVLGVALVLLVAMFLVLGPQTPSFVPSKPSTNITSIAEVTVGPVGFISSVPAKTVQINPFSAGTTQSDSVKSWSVQEISAGLFGGKELSEQVSVNKNVMGFLERVVLEFDINKDKTDPAEDLIVLWNGKEVFKGKPADGHQAIRIPKENVTESNTLKVSTSAPGISSIVKSTTYSLENVNLNQEYGQARVEVVDLESKDLDSFERGEITFSSTPKGGPSGKLIVKVNGFELYNQKPDRFVSISFDQKNVPNLGVANRISFLAEGGFFELSDIKVDLYLLTTTVVKKRSFLLTAEQIKDLEKRKLSLEIDAKSTKPGKLSVTLNNKTIDFSPLQNGLNTKTVSKDDLRDGENTIEFTATGSFDISKARITAE